MGIREDLEQLCILGHYSQALNMASETTEPTKGEVLYWLGDSQAEEELRRHSSVASQQALARWCWQTDRFQEGLQILDSLPASQLNLATRHLITLCQGEEVADTAVDFSGHRQWRYRQDLAITYQCLGKLQQSQEHFLWASSAWANIRPDHPERLVCLFGLSGVLETLSPRSHNTTEVMREFLLHSPIADERRPQVIDAFATLCKSDDQSCLELLAQLPDAAAKKSLAQLLFLQRRWHEVEPIVQQAINELRATGDTPRLAHCLWLNGKTLLALNQQDQAQQNFHEARQLCEPGTTLFNWIKRDLLQSPT